jgi:acetylornithine deacetylase
LTRELVRIDSRNPSLVAGGPGEAAVARALGDVLTSWGFDVDVSDVAPGRPNVVARVGTSGTRSVLFTDIRRRRRGRDDARKLGCD